jgi:hypothetical protein
MKKFLCLYFTLFLLVNTELFSQNTYTLISSCNGCNWDTGSSWIGGNVPDGNIPAGSEIIIPENTLVNVRGGGNKINITNDVDVLIYGTVNFSSGGAQLNLTSGSTIKVAPSGDITTSAPGQSETITIGSGSIKGDNIDALRSPNQITENTLNNGGGCAETEDCEDDPLPIELKSFTASKSNQNINLDWVTAKEENFSHFEIERTVDQDNWEPIGLVQGLGESNSDVNYNFTDRSAPFGVIYYRLKAVDIDATFEYSPVVQVEVGFEGKLAISPNPVKDASNLKIQVPSEFRENLAYVGLFDLNGTKVQEFRNFDTDGTLQINQKMKSGMYILKVNHNGLQENIRVVIQ